MSDGSLGVVGLVALLALNRLVLTIAGDRTWRWLFWTIQVANLLGAAVLLLHGLPGLPPGLRIIDWFIALLFLWHVAENHAKRVKSRHTEAPPGPAATPDSRREAIRERLGASKPRDPSP